MFERSDMKKWTGADPVACFLKVTKQIFWIGSQIKLKDLYCHFQKKTSDRIIPSKSFISIILNTWIYVRACGRKAPFNWANRFIGFWLNIETVFLCRHFEIISDFELSKDFPQVFKIWNFSLIQLAQKGFPY